LKDSVEITGSFFLPSTQTRGFFQSFLSENSHFCGRKFLLLKMSCFCEAELFFGDENSGFEKTAVINL